MDDFIFDNIGDISVIDILWKSIKGLSSLNFKDNVSAVIDIVGVILGISGFFIPTLGLISGIVILLGQFLKIVFRIIKLECIHVREINIPQKDEIFHEIAGLAERLINLSRKIDSLEENSDTHSDLKTNVFNSVSDIGLHEIGSLKSRIKSLMVPIEDDLQKCSQYLTLFVRIALCRHLFLIRCINVFKVKLEDGLHDCLQNILNQEIDDNKKFLRFFSAPTIEDAIIIPFFNPKGKRMEELVKYLDILKLSPQNLSDDLNKNVFEVKPFLRSHVALGRPILSHSYVRGMNALGNKNSPRIQFQFNTVDEDKTCNLFKIKVVGEDKYMYMTVKGYIRYKTLSPEKELAAQWHVIGVHSRENTNESKLSYMLCTQRWPSRIVYMEESFYQCAKGMLSPEKVSAENLFTVSS